ncbi:MAG: hypothetical protein RMK29_00655 [Myxococcales bacterium]|nr:hypothetical protein [Myxococcota bacterium]MDW8280187.1 hypothetical protein [Myxococcales bacterium]
MRHWPPLVLLALTACYQPRLPAGHYRCDKDADCPDHLVCGRGRCVEPGSLDLARPPELSPPPRDPLEFCQGGWFEIVPRSVYACRRSFAVSNNEYGGLCPPGYHVCDRSDNLQIDSANRMAACQAPGGFFSTRIDIALRRVDMNAREADGVCMPQAADQPRALLGCGEGVGLYRLRNNGCDSLQSAVSCAQPASGWLCQSVRNVVYSESQGGLLCCADQA